MRSLIALSLLVAWTLVPGAALASRTDFPFAFPHSHGETPHEPDRPVFLLPLRLR